MFPSRRRSLSIVPPPEQIGAADDLAFIRSTMERASTFTAVPGRGGMAMGCVGIAAALLAGSPEDVVHWLTVWLCAAAIAAPIGTAAMAYKGRTIGSEIWSHAGRRFLLAFVPSLVAGAALTAAVVRAGHTHVIAPLWLLLYGAAVTAGGAHSVRPVVVLGAGLVATGLIALVLPTAYANASLAMGFGVLHIAGGWVIARHHGG